LTLWRISKHVDLSGKGGQLTSARWHNRGRSIVYLTSNPAAALLEVLVHEMPINRVSRHYQWLEIQVDDDLDIAAMPTLDSDWRTNVILTRSIGDVWLDGGGTALMEVPSVLAPKTSNYLLNPGHPDASKLKIASVTKYPLDPRFAPR
jgi:RES domain-containing protein